MNAGPDVQRSIAQWLREESPGRAPDRILANAGSAIDRTKQRRFAVAWREPVSISIRGLALAATLVVVAVIGAGFVGRSTASVGGVPSPSPARTEAPSPSAHVATLAEYRAARDAICDAAWPQRRDFDAQIGDGLTDPRTPAAARAAKLAALQAEMSFERNLLSQTLALDLPPNMAADEAAMAANLNGIFAIVDQEIQLIRDGKYAEATAVDLTTDPLARAAEGYESKYGLRPCP
jgi:hypothetical protein